ncbi:cytochrome P450 [Dichotomopilus funicola]|uniref:Cytochrome P450 n=1 Tax=Dichotomopilus funicola TaxID=1934379 RepID=A0AAN6ZLR0_9PEZI|nr:cytochrome P450 [Dichotomopilus funicola]
MPLLLSRLSENGVTWPSRGLVLYIIGLLLFAHSIQRVRRWYRLSHVPGPLIAGWTNMWLTKGYISGRFFMELPALVEKYGPVIRIAPNQVVCVDVDTLYRISGVRSLYRKSEWYTIARISRDGDHIFTIIDPEERKERKKFIMPAYAGRDIDHFEEGTDRALTDWMELIDTKYLSSAKLARFMNFEEKVHFYALDAIGEIAYSESFGCVKEDRDTKGVMAVNDVTVPLLMAISNYVAFWKMMRMWPFYYLLPHDGDNSGFGAIVGHASTIVRKRLQPKAVPKHDMLQSFIEQGLRDEEALKQEVGIQFFAGSDTVSSLLYTTFLLLLTHPSVYARLQSEIDTALASDPSTTNPPRIITDAQARSIPYLQAIIREGLRLFPPLCAPPIYKEVPAGGDDVCGYALPAGTLVATALQQWHGARDKSFWGEDADAFRPERWLGAAAADEKEGPRARRVWEMTRRMELAFGCGQYVCVGKAIAMVEAGKVLGEVSFGFTSPLH